MQSLPFIVVCPFRIKSNSRFGSPPPSVESSLAIAPGQNPENSREFDEFFVGTAEREIEEELSRGAVLQSRIGVVSHLTFAITIVDSGQHSVGKSYFPQLKPARELQRGG
jgi:hypothetical protein